MGLKIGETPAPAAQSWNNSAAPSKNEGKKAPTPAPKPTPALAAAPQPAPSPPALASAAMAALLEVQERLSERDQGHGRALEVISDLIDRLGDKTPKPPEPPVTLPPVTPPVTPPPVVTRPPVTPPPVEPPPITPPPAEPPPVEPPPVEPEPTPPPPPASLAPRLAPAQRLQAVLAQLHEAPVQRYSSVPFSKRQTARTTAAGSANRSAVVRTVKTAITSNTALALLQAAPMNLYAYRAPAAYAPSYFGINRFI